VNAAPVEEGTWLEIVRQQVGSLRFGIVQIVVHDSRVVKIEPKSPIANSKSEPMLHARRLKPTRRLEAEQRTQGT